MLCLAPGTKGMANAGADGGGDPCNIREAIELFLETLTDDERSAALSREILTTSVEVHA